MTPLEQWAEKYCTNEGEAPAGNRFWNFDILETEEGLSWIRVHTADSDGQCGLDMFYAPKTMGSQVGVYLGSYTKIKEVENLISLIKEAVNR